MKNRILPFALALTFCWHCSLAQWTSLGSGITPTPRVLGGFYPVDSNVIWGFSAHATSFTPTHEFTRTTDGGQTWLPGTMAGVESPQFPICLYALNGQTAWLATADELDPISGRMYKTTDGGTTWVHQNTGFTGFNETPAGVWFWNENEGFAYGATWYGNYNDQLAIYTTADGGNNWSKVVAPDMPAQLAGEGMCIYNYAGFFSVVNDNVWFGTSKGRIFRSTDKGLTWQSSSTPIAPAAITSVSFRSDQVGLAVTSSPFKIVRTTDGGQTWNQISGPFPAGVVGAQVEYVPGTRSTWFMVAGATKYMVSYNDGETWEIFSSNIDAWSVEFLNAKTGFAGSSVGSPKTASLHKWSGPALGNRLFVNDDAAGLNDGTSWANAYNDLQDALVIAEAGDQIWVAEGTYKPDTIGGAQTSTFLIDKNLQLYGGFAGTETTLAQRGDPKEHPTILSGDLIGNDLDNNPTANKLDNVLHVMKITAAATNETIVDGFTIKRGHADWPTPGADQNGGGVNCEGAPIFRNCSFDQNYAINSGGGLYLNGTNSNGAMVESCIFKKNQADQSFDAGGGLYIRNVAGIGVTVNKSEFIENKGGRGGGIANFNSNLIVTKSLFSGNINPYQGGGLWCWAANPTLTTKVDSCTFENNQSSFGGGMYFSAVQNGCSLNVSNSTFSENINIPNSEGWGQTGGGLFIYTNAPNISIEIENSTFEANSSTGNSGAVGINAYGNNVIVDIINSNFLANATQGNSAALGIRGYGQNLIVDVKNSTFTENECTGFYATTSVWTWTPTSTAEVTFEACVFKENLGVNTGALDIGSGLNAGPANFTVRNCEMLNNQVSNFSGGLSLWGDAGSSPTFNVEDCLITGNSAGERAGGIWILTSSEHFNAKLDRCVIMDNHSPWGSAIGAFQADLAEYGVPTGSVFSIDNSLVASNTGDGGIITLDSFPGFQILNTTVANNQSSAITLGDQSHLTLQNTILHNPNYIEFQATNETATFTSHGGNLIGDNSLAGPGLLIPTDKQGLDPLFVGSGDYHLQLSSPCVDAGKDDGVTAAFDLDGAPRIQGGRVDMGAYESPYVSSSREIIAGELALSPNPAADFLNLHLPETTTNPLQVSLFDPQGRLLQNQVLASGQRVNVQRLAVGFYTVKVADGDRVYVGKFIKQ